MTMPKGRLHNPDHPSQEVLANGAVCGNALQAEVQRWLSVAPRFIDPDRGVIYYPWAWFGPDDEPLISPLTEATMALRAHYLPVLAWAVAPGDGSAAVVVDMQERPGGPGIESERGEPVTYNDCKLILGTPSEVLPRRILERMGLI